MNGRKVNILVTGGAGYIGSHACKALSEHGYEPVAFDSLVYGHRDFVKWGKFEGGDIMESASLDAVFKKYRPQAVMHFAAFAYVGESVEDPAKYYRNNVIGAFNLLEAARASGVKNVIFSSTCATYGVPSEIPILETHIQKPINPYGKTKLMIEMMLRDYDTAYAMKSVSLRYFNAAGADPQAEIGEDHTPETHLIPLVLDVAAGRRPHINVFGSDYETPDGTCIRDYIHVADLAQAHVLALEYLLGGGETAAFNLGNGSGHSVRGVLEAARRITKRDIAVKEGERRPGDPPCLVGSSEKIKKALNWIPQYGDIDTIIKHAWNWHIKRFQTDKS